VLDALEAGAQLLLDAALAERALEQLAAALLLERDEVGERLDDGHLGAEGAPDRRELAADGAAPRMTDRAGDGVHAQGVVAVDDAGVVDLETGDRAGHRAGRQQHVARLDGAALDLDGGRRHEAPWPCTTSILRLFTRPVRPLNRPSTTLSLYLLTPPMSTDSKVPLTPNCADSLMTSTVSAEWSSALVGMQPRCRQVPPTLSFSTMTTVMPSSAARRAAAYPPLPPPRTTRSTGDPDG
jgi:hypothetical protein